MRLSFKKIFVIFVLVGCINLPFAAAQEADLAALGTKKPVMYSVFGTRSGAQHGVQQWVFLTI